MSWFSFLRKPIYEINNIREEVENKIASILDSIRLSDSITDVEITMIKEVIEVILKQVKITLPDGIAQEIAETIVKKGINGINLAISTQLKK